VAPLDVLGIALPMTGYPTTTFPVTFLLARARWIGVAYPQHGGDTTAALPAPASEG
jgi:hypothetical protein